MGYTSVKGGADAIAAAERLIQVLQMDSDEVRIELRQVRHQLGAAVDQVMGEGGLYAPDLAALAFKQAEGDMAEASFMVRAYRSTLPRLGYSVPVAGTQMRVQRRISSTFRDVPGGQLLGRTRDYTQRLLDLETESSDRLREVDTPEATNEIEPWDLHPPKVSDTMRAMGLIPPAKPVDESVEPDDITRNAMRFPVTRSAWLQALSRSETGALVALAYSSLRGYGASDHGTIAELRVGELPMRVTHPVTGEPFTIGHIRVTECEMTGSESKKKKGAGEPKGGNYGLSYGMAFGQNERKAISMSILDSSLMAAAAAATEEGNPAPANDQEMVLYSSDGIESFGFVEHLKLPHFVTFGSGIAVNEDPGQVAGSEETILDEFTPIDALDREREAATAGAPAGGSAS
jgi:alpha-D-ribose 1-methylphosphonate 5-triphosphate synthase subunit PhnI